jgi:hypothetical protein
LNQAPPAKLFNVSSDPHLGNVQDCYLYSELIAHQAVMSGYLFSTNGVMVICLHKLKECLQTTEIIGVLPILRIFKADTDNIRNCRIRNFTSGC